MLSVVEIVLQLCLNYNRIKEKNLGWAVKKYQSVQLSSAKVLGYSIADKLLLVLSTIQIVILGISVKLWRWLKPINSYVFSTEVLQGSKYLSVGMVRGLLFIPKQSSSFSAHISEVKRQYFFNYVAPKFDRIVIS